MKVIVLNYKLHSRLGKLKLRTSFNDGEKHKSTEPSEFIVLGPDWPDHYPDLILGMPWLRENGATIDICNSKLSIGDNFAIPFEEVKYKPTQKLGSTNFCMMMQCDRS